MESRDQLNQIQCVVDEGTLVNRRDMSRILRDLGPVRYQEIVDGTLRRQGEGVIVRVAADDSSATVVVNKRLYLNVTGFDCLRLGCDEAGGAHVDLVSESRVLRLIPTTDPILDRPVPLEAEAPPARQTLDRLFGGSFAEVYLDEDDDSDEE